MNDINTWYSELSEPMRIAVIGGFATLLAAVFAGLVSLLVMWVQGKMARRAVEAQERTIFLDLIERRANWFDEAQELWAQWTVDQDRHVETILQSQIPDTGMIMPWMAYSRRQAMWLFGPEVIHHLDKLEASVGRYGERRLRIREVGQMDEVERRTVDVLERQLDHVKALDEVMALKEGLGDVLIPYLYVGDIRAHMPTA